MFPCVNNSQITCNNYCTAFSNLYRQFAFHQISLQRDVDLRQKFKAESCYFEQFFHAVMNKFNAKRGKPATRQSITWQKAIYRD